MLWDAFCVEAADGTGGIPIRIETGSERIGACNRRKIDIQHVCAGKYQTMGENGA